MKTTLELPDELMRTIKLRAVREDRKLKDLVAELLEVGLASSADEATRAPRRVQFPILRGGHAANPGEEMTPERIADLLLEQEVEWLVR